MARNRILTVALSTLAALGLAASAFAASDTATASVDIVAALAVTNTQGMSFGDIVPPTSGTQDFVLSATGTMTPGGGTGQYIGNAVEASFDVTGTGNMAVTVTPTVATNFSDAALTLASLSTGGTANSAIPAGGSGTITVGGTLTVAAGANPGNHTATIDLEVLYQ